MTASAVFAGYPQEGVDFLSELAKNNDRAWFNERKADFDELIQKPTQAFVVALGQRLQLVSPGIGYDTRLVGGSIMRIYRDIRFSKDKTPFHTKVRLVFWDGPSRKEMLSGIHVQIDPAGAGVFLGIWEFERAQLSGYRDAVLDDSLGTGLEQAIRAVQAAGGYTVGGEHFKRVPQGYDVEHPRAGLLKYNGLYAHTTESIGPDVITRPDLVDVCFEHCRNLAPIHHWMVALPTS